MVKGFLRAEGRKIVNEDGDTVILRGWGAGNWMNPEGFMVGGTHPSQGGYSQPKKLDRARSMDAVLRELCGSAYADSFWPRWYRKHLSERDIQAMAELGYNSLRLPLNSAGFLDEEPGIHWNKDSFSMLDDVLNWCETYRIYAILDLHAAPGGQSCGACDNGVDNVPHLFIDEENRERAMLLWEKLAERYKERWIVGAYDLLNEPINDPSQIPVYEEQLKSFYEELITRILVIDQKHLLTVEGTVWASHPGIFDHAYDPVYKNWCIHIHNYRYIPEVQELSAIMECALDLDVSVWMGEGGAGEKENAVFLQILEKENIGYSLWCWKAAEGSGDGVMPEDRTPASHALPKDWHLIYDYADHGGQKPGYEKSMRIFEEYPELLDYDRCEHPETRHSYILRQPGVAIPAAGYDHGAFGEAFHGDWSYGNAFQYREADRMKLIRKPGKAAPGPKALWGFYGYRLQNLPSALDSLMLALRKGEFVHYTVKDVKESCLVSLRLRCEEPSVLRVSCAGMEQILQITPTKDFREIQMLKLPAGEEYAVRIETLEGEILLEEVLFQ